MNPKTKRKLRWTSDRWYSQSGSIRYSIVDHGGCFEVSAVDLASRDLEVLVDVLKTKCQAVAACEKHSREQKKKGRG